MTYQVKCTSYFDATFLMI